MKVLSLFSGIGAFEKALDRLGIDYELVGFSEIDKYAVKSYCAIHGVDESLNYGDITKIDAKALPKDIDLITYGFPCQDISIAGQQKGLLNEDGTKTRSGLFFDALRIIEETKPRVAIAENVKNLTSKSFKKQFSIVLESLEAAGYNNYWQVLNGKDYGVPQNRERVFIVSIRKNIDTGAFEFPKPFTLDTRLKDILEDSVDEKFYLSDARIEKLLEHKRRNAENGNGFGAKFVNENDISSALTTSPEKSSGQYLRETQPTLIGGMQKNQSIKQNGICTTLTSPMGTGGGYIPMVVEQPQVVQVGNCCPTKTRNNPNQGRIYDTEGLAPCLNQMGGGNRQPFVSNNSNVIRKLTPKECWRLMDFDDTDFEKADVVNSNTQLYKQAGNSIIVRVCQYLLQALVDAGVFNSPIEDATQAFIEPKEYITPLMFAQRIAELQERYGDMVNIFHNEADKVICEVMKQEGYHYGIEIYQNVRKWYA